MSRARSPGRTAAYAVAPKADTKVTDAKQLAKTWQVRGKVLDLDAFLDRHPGGRELLEMTRGIGDITETFELHHPMADPERMDALLKKYEVGTAERRVDAGTFDKDGFYRTLSRRVREHFRSSGIDHHAPAHWYLKIVTQTALMLVFFGVMAGMVSLPESLSPCSARALQMLAAVGAGHVFIQCGFTIMHDGSHHAISRHAAVNEWLSRVWCSLAWWHHDLWTKHHVLEHHAYTGDPSRDPDVIHLKPLVRKSDSTRSSSYFSVPRPLRSAWVVLMTCVFPGSAVGQALLYNFQWIRRGYLWRMEVPDIKRAGVLKFAADLVLKLGHLGIHIWMADPVVSMIFLLALNVTYAACLLPDHDTVGTYEHHVDNYKGNDWGATQVWNSASWSVGSAAFTECFGGINMQIEHHLFPTVSHSHHRAIHPIVERTCKEFNVKYTEYPSAWTAICAVVENLTERMEGNTTSGESRKTK